MPAITIYTKDWCPYCDAAKALLRQKKAVFTEIVVKSSVEQLEMCKKAGGKTTVPQIWIGEKHVGGCDDLHALESKGQLDKLLAA